MNGCTLLWRRSVGKFAVLALLSGNTAFGDARQPCPPLEVSQSCTAEGAVSLMLRPGRESPPALSYIVSLQGGDAPAQTLPPEGTLSLQIPNPKGQQITLAIVGEEPEGGGMAACCFSNQRLHLPAACPAPKPEASIPDPDPNADIALDLTLDATCRQGPRGGSCAGKIALSDAAGTDLPVTLSSDSATRLEITDTRCTAFKDGWAMCWLRPDASLPLTLTLKPDTPKGEVTLCADLESPKDGRARTLALQSALDRAGYPVGPIDGDFGPATLQALSNFNEDVGLPPITEHVPPEVLELIGLAPHTDSNPANDRICATALVPAPVLTCDPATTRASGDNCLCRFKGMERASVSACACPKGQRLSKSGCVAKKDTSSNTANPAETASTTVIADPTPPEPACDPATTVLRNGACVCREQGMVQENATICVVVPPDDLCAKRNAVGECCDLLPAGDASCR